MSTGSDDPIRCLSLTCLQFQLRCTYVISTVLHWAQTARPRKRSMALLVFSHRLAIHSCIFSQDISFMKFSYWRSVVIFRARRFIHGFSFMKSAFCHDISFITFLSVKKRALPAGWTLGRARQPMLRRREWKVWQKHIHF